MLAGVPTTAHTSETRLFGLEGAAKYLDTTPRTVQRLVHKGVLKPVRIAGLRRILFDRRDLDALIETAKKEPEPMGSNPTTQVEG